jgi:hypothetical protein
LIALSGPVLSDTALGFGSGIYFPGVVSSNAYESGDRGGSSATLGDLLPQSGLIDFHGQGERTAFLELDHSTEKMGLGISTYWTGRRGAIGVIAFGVGKWKRIRVRYGAGASYHRSRVKSEIASDLGSFLQVCLQTQHAVAPFVGARLEVITAKDEANRRFGMGGIQLGLRIRR